MSHFRPIFHFSPIAGWINDPNGLVFHDGLWHLFYQHEPNQTVWGPMHWGHAVSRDLGRWEHLPIALAPDALGAIFSGSAAIVDDGRMCACFTYATDEGVQSVALAFSGDGGRTFEKLADNPVLTSERRDFRDPKIFRWNDEWRLIIAAGPDGQIFRSPDLLNWTWLSDVPAPHPSWIWECPDLFPLDGKWVLVASFIVPDVPHQTHFWLGDFDGNTFSPDSDPHRLSCGPDDYAAVSWNEAPDNRRVLIGWMSAWPYADKTPTASEGWRGAMTLPRELTVSGGVLRQNPPREIEAQRGAALSFNGTRTQVEHEGFEIETEVSLSQTPENAELRVWWGQQWASVSYDGATRELVLDRSHAGQTEFHPSFATQFRTPLDVPNGKLKLRVFVDRCSLEVFAQDGAQYGAMLVFPTQGARAVEWTGQGVRLEHGAIYSLWV